MCIGWRKCFFIRLRNCPDEPALLSVTVLIQLICLRNVDDAFEKRTQSFNRAAGGYVVRVAGNDHLFHAVCPGDPDDEPAMLE